MIRTEYTRAVEYIAESVIQQIEDGHAPHRQYNAQCADGEHRPSVRVYFADIPYLGHLTGTVPGGAVRVAVDLAPYRRPAHEARVFFEPHDYDAGEAAADIAAAVLELIDGTADYAR